METNRKDGLRPAATPVTPPGGPILIVQPLRAVSPFLRTQQPSFPSSHPPPQQSSYIPSNPQQPSLCRTNPQQAFSAPSNRFPVFDPADIRRRIQEDILLKRAKEQSQAFAVPGVRNPADSSQACIDETPLKNSEEATFNGVKNEVSDLPPVPKFFDPRAFAIYDKDRATCREFPSTVAGQTDVKINTRMVYDHRGHVNVEKCPVGAENVKTECPLHSYLYMQGVAKPGIVPQPVVHDKNPISNENFLGGISQSTCPLHTSLLQQRPSGLNTTTIPENLKNTKAEARFQGKTRSLEQGGATTCRDSPMETKNPIIATTPVKLSAELPLPIIPKLEHITETAITNNSTCLSSNNPSLIPKFESVNPSCLAALHLQLQWGSASNNLSLISKPESVNPGCVAVLNAQLQDGSASSSNNLSLLPKAESVNLGGLTTLHSQLQYGSASASVDSSITTQTIPSAEELRSALAKSLSRYKDLTVLHPTGSVLESQYTVSVKTEAEASSKKRKRPNKRPRPRPMLRNPSDNDRELVMRALMTFEALRRSLQDTKRPDLQAGVIMMDRGLAVNRGKRVVGPVPGVNVGDHFYFRMELCVVGLHCPTQAGIDYIAAKDSELNEPIGTSIIASGGYMDDEDGGEELIYTGQGGNNYVADKKQSFDQKLERGNYALERSKFYQLEIRVIRGIKDMRSPSGKIYIYDGLYKVQESWLDRGRSGSGVFKYRLQRTPGQPELGSAILKNARRWKLQPALRAGLLHPDISSRSENFPVCVVNDVDNEKGPPHFDYITSVRLPCSLVTICEGCQCVGGCTAGDTCSCIRRNGGQMPYNANAILIKGSPLIYECGIHCNCPLTCLNRVTQRGLNIHLEVFRTRGASVSANPNGWGLRSWDPIAAGSFICEYIGEVFPRGVDTVLPCDMDNEYILDPKRQGTECGDVSHILREERQQLSVSSTEACPATTPNLNFFIDSSKMGNVSRFINRSSFPNANVSMQFVVHDSDGNKFPHVMLFAMYNIPPLTELLLDYKEEKVLPKPKEVVEAGTPPTPAFECSQSVVKNEPRE